MTYDLGEALASAARKALLQRLADGMAVVAEPWTKWTCCTLTFQAGLAPGMTGSYELRICNGPPPIAGTIVRLRDGITEIVRACDHRHHITHGD